ncbi:MAG: FAD-dependent oxidoreductase [Halobacteriales archaeon]
MADSVSLPDQAETLVVGAGLVGSSIAQALATTESSAVTVVDQGPLPRTGGTSSFAPSGVFQVAPGRTQSKLAQRTRTLARQYDAYVENGSLEVATTADYQRTLEHRVDQAEVWGVEAELVDGAAAASQFPSLDVDRVRSAVQVQSDGWLSSVEFLEGLRSQAEAQGATFHGGVEVTGLQTDGRAVTGVVTNYGEIATDRLVLATNVWTPSILDSVGIDLPLTPVVHQYGVTNALDALGAADADGPWLRYPEAGVYARPLGDAVGIGSYNHEPIVVDPTNLDGPSEAVDGPGIYELQADGAVEWDPGAYPAARPFTEADFAPALEDLSELVPALAGTEIAAGVNGLMAVTPDNNPILGELPGLDGCWLAVAVPAMLSGGVGEVLAGLMEHDDTAFDVDPWHVARFQPHSCSPSFARAQGAATYRNMTGAPQAGGIEGTGETLRESPYYRFQDELGAHFYDLRYGGWKRPMRFATNEALLEQYDIPDRAERGEEWSPVEAVEHLAVRDRVGMSDLTSFSTFDIVGPRAVEFAQSVFSNDVDRPAGEVTYTLLLDESGGIHGDMTVVPRGPNHLHVISNSGGAGTKQIARLRRLAPDDGSVQIVNRIGARCGISVSGPNARDMLEPVVDASLDNDAFPFFTAKDTYVDDIPVLAARLSYVGELGWEFHTSMDYGAELWRTLWEAGQDHGVLPFGDGALVTLRLEKGFPAYGVDIHPAVTPIEAGLEYTVDFETEFRGREKLLTQRDEGVDRQRTTMVLEDPDAVVQSGKPVYDGETCIGYLSSAGEGYHINEFIVYGYVPPEYGEAGTSLEIQSGNERYSATVTEPVLFDPDRERLQG